MQIIALNENDRSSNDIDNTSSGDVYYNGDVALTQFNQFNVVEIELAEDVKADDKDGFNIFYMDKGNISVIKDVDLKRLIKSFLITSTHIEVI
ncbi:hypothetical protein ACVXZZ_13515 [Staphylococcus aureus]